MRRGVGLRVLVSVAITVCAHVPAGAATPASNDRAYTLTLMCAGVAGYDKNDADITRTMAAVRKMAKAKGYDTKRVSSDAIEMAQVLGDDLRNNPNSMDENRALCRKLKLID